MTAALTPELALDYVRELSADVRAGVVLDAAGARLAGPPTLAGPAAEAVAALAVGQEGQALRADGAVFAVRGERVALVLACGPRALPELARHDLRLVLGDLGDAVVAGGAPRTLPAPVVSAVLSAAHGGADAS